MEYSLIFQFEIEIILNKTHVVLQK